MQQALSRYWIELKKKREGWGLSSACVLLPECSGRTFWSFRSGSFEILLHPVRARTGHRSKKVILNAAARSIVFRRSSQSPGREIPSDIPPDLPDAAPSRPSFHTPCSGIHICARPSSGRAGAVRGQVRSHAEALRFPPHLTVPR